MRGSAWIDWLFSLATRGINMSNLETIKTNETETLQKNGEADVSDNTPLTSTSSTETVAKDTVPLDIEDACPNIEHNMCPNSSDTTLGTETVKEENVNISPENDSNSTNGKANNGLPQEFDLSARLDPIVWARMPPGAKKRYLRERRRSIMGPFMSPSTPKPKIKADPESSATTSIQSPDGNEIKNEQLNSNISQISESTTSSSSVQNISSSDVSFGNTRLIDPNTWARMTGSERARHIANNRRSYHDSKYHYKRNSPQFSRGPPPKKFKFQQHTYGDISTDIQMAIVPTNYPEVSLNIEQVELIQSKLWEKLFDSCTQDTEGPQFKGLRREDGALVIICGNDITKQWIESVVPSFAPWEGASLTVGEAPVLLNRYKLLLTVPEPAHQKPAADVLKVLQFQNPGLKTSDWRVIDCKVDEKHQSITISVDEDSFRSLEARGYRAHLGLGQVTFKKIYISKYAKPPEHDVPNRSESTSHSSI